MASLFKLVGSIFIDNEEADKSLAKTEQKAGSLGDSLVNGAKTAGKFAAGVATAAAGAVAGLTKMASDSASSMDVIDKASQKMGITTEAYQEWSHVMSLSGMDISTMQTGMKTLQNQMDALAQGNETAIELFDRLGVSVYDADGAMKDQTTMMNDAILALAEMGDGAERTALAVDLFGKSGTEMLPMLNSGADGIAAMKQEAHDLGLVFSEDAVKSGAALNDALSNVKDSASALVTGLGASLMPVVTDLCKLITDNMPVIKSLFEKLAPILVNLFEQLMPHIVSLAETLLPIIAGLFDVLLPVFSDICEAILPIIVNLLEEVMPIFIQLAQMILPVIADILTAILPILQPILELLAPILQLILELIEPLLKLIDLILPPIIQLISTVVGWLADKLSVAISWVVERVKGMKDVFQTLKDFLPKLRDTFKEVWENIVEFVRKPTNAIIGFINGLISGVVSGINTIVKAMNSLHFDVPDWVPGLGGKSFGFNLKELTAPQIPLLAEGAVIEPNKPFAAVLGDQRNGTNIEAPLDTIKQAVLEVLGDNLIEGIEEAMTRAFQTVEINWNDRNLGRLVNAYAR